MGLWSGFASWTCASSNLLRELLECQDAATGVDPRIALAWRDWAGRHPLFVLRCGANHPDADPKPDVVQRCGALVWILHLGLVHRMLRELLECQDAAMGVDPRIALAWRGWWR